MNGSRGLPPLRDDGLPTLPTGEPVLARWFVLAMLLLAPVAVAVTVWALTTIPEAAPVPPAERRPPGDGTVTIERGDAQLGGATGSATGPGCAGGILVVGEPETRTVAEQALTTVCDLLGAGDFPEARAGLGDWTASDGRLRFATFELSGVESSARVEQERIVLELNAKFLLTGARGAAPALLHQLVLLAQPSWPGAPITAATELRATRAQADACQRLELSDAAVRGCRDATQLLAADDPEAALVEAGFPPG